MANQESAPIYAAAEDLVKNPRETLARELKEWLDPSKDEDRANLVKAILAMRNHEFGGAIAIGISKDGSHQQAPGFDVEPAYQQEAIQAIVSRHASRSFEVEVCWVEFNSVRYPVVVVPGGIDMPVVCKSTIGQGQKPHLRESAIYVRSLEQNGIPSSAQASWKDVERLFEVCFRNREADYGDFIERLLRAASPNEIRSLVTKARDISAQALEAYEGIVTFREYALDRFSTAVREKKLDVAKIGFLDLALVFDGMPERKWQNDEQFLNTLLVAHPDLSGAWVWKILRTHGPEFEPYPIGNTYEQQLFISPAKSIRPWGFIQFMIFDPSGRFFLRKSYFEDLLKDAPEDRGKALDPVSHMAILSEAFVVGSAFAKALAYPLETESHFAIRWNSLKGRKLVNWTTKQYDFYLAKECRDESVELEITLPIAAAKQEIIQKTTEAIQKLGRAFNITIAEQIVANEVTKLLNRTF
jgi:hypothetical protein